MKKLIYSIFAITVVAMTCACEKMVLKMTDRNFM